MEIRLGCGTGVQTAVIPDSAVKDILQPAAPKEIPDEKTVIAGALAHPIGTLPLRELARGKRTAVIVISDITRPLPSAKLLPFVLDELYAAGIGAESVTVISALGSHRKQTDGERRKCVGERAWTEVRCIDSDADGCVRLGVTSRGTPVEIDRHVAEAELKICLGNIEYHYFAGYSGGAKAVMPGVSTREAIRANHSLMADSRSFAGSLEGNPVREDLEEAADIVGVDFILNVVLDGHKRIIGAFAGDVTKAHREGCRFLDTVCCSYISEKADIVIVSQGGAPKDLNLYQTQKALDNAHYAVKDGGIIILVGACGEGFGEATFERWFEEADSPETLISRIGKEFRLGGHKAAAIAKVLVKSDVYLVSEMDAEKVRGAFMTPFSSLEEACAAAFRAKGEDASVIVMPYGGSTLPSLRRTE